VSDAIMLLSSLDLTAGTARTGHSRQIPRQCQTFYRESKT
jgi:hypothetical protein